MKKYPLIDVFRFVCACLVVVIHLAPNQIAPCADMIKVCFARQAVPFFFIVSGFFFAKKLETIQDKRKFVLQYTKRLLIIYGIWALIYFPELLHDYTQLYPGASSMYIALVLARRVFFAGVAQFWYVLVLAETALISGLLLIYHKEKLLYWIGGIGFCLSLIYILEIPLPVFELYNKAVYSIFSWNLNFLMFGIPFFSVGIFFHRIQERLCVDTRKLIFAYLMISIFNIICYTAGYGTEINVENFLSLFAFQSVLLFLIGIQTTNIAIPDSISELCRSSSGAIYCLHNFVIRYFLGEVLPWSTYFIVNYVVVIGVCICLFYLVRISQIKPLYRLITLK